MEDTGHIGALKNILLATDGSVYSEYAVKEAIALARSHATRLPVIYVLEVNPEFATEGQKFVEKLEIEAKDYLDRIKKEASGEDVELEIIVRRGEETYKAIVEEAEKRNTDVIVMGTRGRTGIKKLLMGSVAAKVIGHAHCNVLVVPKDAAIHCKSIIAATDGSRHGDAAASTAIEIGKNCGSKLAVVSVVSSEGLVHIEHSRLHLHRAAEEEFGRIESSVKSIKDRATKRGVDAEGVILSGSPAETIINIAKEKNADLIVMGSHGKTGLDRLLIGSVAERVIMLSPCAVLVVKAE